MPIMSRHKTDTGDTTTDDDSNGSSETIETTFLHLPQKKIKFVVGSGATSLADLSKKASNWSLNLGWFLGAAAIVLVTIAFVAHFFYTELKNDKSQVHMSEDFRNNCLPVCKPFMECAITTLNCRCIYGYPQVANQCIVQTSPISVCDTCRKKTNQDCNTQGTACVCKDKSEKTKIKFCTRSPKIECTAEEGFRCLRKAECSKAFNEAANRSSFKHTRFAVNFFNSVFRSYNAVRREADLFKYFHAISLIKAARSYEPCTAAFPYDCIDLLQRSISAIRDRTGNNLVLRKITSTYDFVKGCIKAPWNCSGLLPRGGIIVEEYVRSGIEAVAILKSLQQFGFFATRTNFFHLRNSVDETSLSVNALILNILVMDTKWSRQKAYFEKKLKELRLLKYDGKILLGLNMHEHNLLEDKCITPIMNSYTAFVTSSNWRLSEKFLKEVRWPPKYCVLPKLDVSGGIWSQKKVESDRNNRILPLWMYNEFCLQSTEKACRESLVASFLTELFLNNYEVSDCEGFECEYMISHILCNMEGLCNVKNYVMYRIWVHAMLEHNVYHPIPTGNVEPSSGLPGDCIVMEKL